MLISNFEPHITRIWQVCIFVYSHILAYIYILFVLITVATYNEYLQIREMYALCIESTDVHSEIRTCICYKFRHSFSGFQLIHKILALPNSAYKHVIQIKYMY